MCEYTGAKKDPLRYSPDDLPAHVVDDMTKSLLNETLADCGRVGLAPFCKDNPAPKVEITLSKNVYLIFLMLHPYSQHTQSLAGG